MFKEFRAFIARGNVLDLAVAVIIGAAFGKVITSLTDDIIMPLIGKATGGLDFSSHFVRLGEIPADYKGSLTSYADLKKAGVPLLGYGEFLTQVVDFLIIAWAIFLLVRALNNAAARFEHDKKDTAAVADSPEVVLLREIRDELRTTGPSKSAGATKSSATSRTAKKLPLDGE
jgi:large conductance mechanosensitive channel